MYQEEEMDGWDEDDEEWDDDIWEDDDDDWQVWKEIYISRILLRILSIRLYVRFNSFSQGELQRTGTGAASPRWTTIDLSRNSIIAKSPDESETNA